MEDDAPDSDNEVIDDFPDIDFEENDLKNNEDLEKSHTKSGESIQSALWINPNERDIEDLKRFVHCGSPYNHVYSVLRL